MSGLQHLNALTLAANPFSSFCTLYQPARVSITGSSPTPCFALLKQTRPDVGMKYPLPHSWYCEVATSRWRCTSVWSRSQQEPAFSVGLHVVLFGFMTPACPRRWRPRRVCWCRIYICCYLGMCIRVSHHSFRWFRFFFSVSGIPALTSPSMRIGSDNLTSIHLINVDTSGASTSPHI